MRRALRLRLLVRRGRARDRAAAALRRLLRDGGADPVRDLLRDQPDVVARARHRRPVLVRRRSRSSAPGRIRAPGSRSTTGCPGGCYAPVGIAIGAVGGLLVALPAVRLRGVYFALLTIGLVEACNQYVTSDTENLGGAQGLVGADSIIPPSKQGLIEGYYYAYVAIARDRRHRAARLLVGRRPAASACGCRPRASPSRSRRRSASTSRGRASPCS